MIELIVWWVYCRNPVPATTIAVGLICSLTRSAWLGVAGATPLLAVKMHQKRRLGLHSALGLVLFVTSIPVLGLTDYILYNRTGQDESA